MRGLRDIASASAARRHKSKSGGEPYVVEGPVEGVPIGRVPEVAQHKEVVPDQRAYVSTEDCLTIETGARQKEC